MITIIRQPENTTITFEKLNTVRQLLNRIDERETSVLVIRGEELLTMDRKLYHGDTIIIRGVRSRG